jgi:hypothetical protein
MTTDIKIILLVFIIIFFIDSSHNKVEDNIKIENLNYEIKLRNEILTTKNLKLQKSLIELDSTIRDLQQSLKNDSIRLSIILNSLKNEKI